MSDYLPLYIDLKGRRVVVFGGGAVGERKAQYFAGVADLTVISPAFTPVLLSMEITRIEKAATPEEIPEYIKGAFLVVAATGDEAFDDAVVKEARASGILANSAHGESEVILPSKITRGSLSVAIATGGKSPAMSKYLRQRLEASLGPEMDDMVRLQADVREVLKKVVPEQKDREKILWEILKAPAVWEALATSYDDALTLALMRIKERKP